MNKKLSIVLAVVLATLLFSFGVAYADAPKTNQQTTYVLPMSLIVIEEEAFSGTAVETVVLPKGFLRIDIKAFADTCYLTDVYIPNTTEYIDDSAFSTTSNLTIHGIEGSYAEDWAYRHKIPFAIDDIWNVIVLRDNSQKTQTNPIKRFISAVVLIIVFSFFRSCYYDLRSRRPQDRPELHPIEYRFP